MQCKQPRRAVRIKHTARIHNHIWLRRATRADEQRGRKKTHTQVIAHKKDESWHSLGMKEQNKYKEYTSRLSNNGKRSKKRWDYKHMSRHPLVLQSHLPGRWTLQAKVLRKVVNNRQSKTVKGLNIVRRGIRTDRHNWALAFASGESQPWIINRRLL